MTLNKFQQEMYERAAMLCSRSEKSKFGISRKLAEWGLNDNEATMIVDKLTEDGFIDEVRYARSYVRDKFRFNKWGKIKISYQLKSERINAGTILQALCEIDESDYMETLQELVKTKNKGLKAVNDYDRRAKLFRFAQSRGFESELISKAIDAI